MPNAPKLVETIHPQVITEGASYGPLNLNHYISSDTDSGKTHFSAELEDGQPLPAGIVCTDNGMFSGIPKKNTHGSYIVVVKAKNNAGETLAQFPLTIVEAQAAEGYLFATSLKSKVWEALGKNLPIPEIGDLFNRPLSPIEIYYLLQRYATLTIWDVYNLDPPSEKKLLELGGSEHYHIYDRGSCLVGGPKDLFSYERTLEDALVTARVMAREVYNRGWTIEFAGFNKMIRAGWVELQLLADVHGKSLEILHFHPTDQDFKLYEAAVKHMQQLVKGM